MRTLFVSLASILLMLVIGCTAVDPDECWVNTSGGFGGGGTIPIGAGVGATSSGDFVTPPAGEPLDYGGDPNPCMAGKVSYFEPSDFPFVVTVADDGTGPAGGWQEAKAGLIFGPSSDGGRACVGLIEMPLRTSAWGKVSPSYAAIYTANVANAVAEKLKKDGLFDLPVGIFCDRVDTEMKEQFKERYKGMGAKVTVKFPS